MDSEQGAPFIPLLTLMIRSACKSRELPYDSQDVTLVNEDGAQGCSCSAESSKKNTHPIILGNMYMWTNFSKTCDDDSGITEAIFE